MQSLIATINIVDNILLVNHNKTMENFTAVKVNDTNIKIKKITFNNVRKGDWVLHLVQEDEGLFGWLSNSLTEAVNVKEWYGDRFERADFKVSADGVLSSVDPSWPVESPWRDVLSVADWHDTEPGHSIWQVEF